MKVLLVDDDIEMLEFLRRLTENAGEDWTVAGLAEDGVEALELLKQTPVDILVTDITMVDMDGLELIAQARECCPGLRSLLITCHEDFQYAQEGIQLGVEDYLLKHTLTEKKYHQALERVKEKIQHTRRQKDSFNNLSSEVYKNREHFRENLISTVLQAPAADIQPLVSKAPLYGIDLPQGLFTVTGIFMVDDSTGQQRGEELNLLSYAVMNIAQELIEFASIFSFRYEGHIYLLVWNAEQIPTWRRQLKERLEKLRELFQNSFRRQLCAIVGNHPVTFMQLGATLGNLGALRDCYFYDQGVHLEEAIRCGSLSDPVDPALMESLKDHLFDIHKLKERFGQACELICHRRYAPVKVHAFFDEFVSELRMVARYTGQWLPHSPLHADTFSDCCKPVMAMLDFLEQSQFWQSGKHPGKDVMEVVEYINANLQEDISLGGAAEVVHKNSSYLSRQFKKETGYSFSEFVIRQRIQKATYLLQHTDLPAEQISGEIGISNSQYFFTFFKRETGRSPGDLRKTKNESTPPVAE